MNDPDTRRLVYIGGAALIGFAIVNQIYDAGFAAGMSAAGGTGYYDGPGFFPFPLLILGFIGFLFYRRRAKRNGAGALGSGRGRGHGPGGGGGFGSGFGGGRPPRLFEEWHRRAHESDPSLGSSPAARRAAPAPESRAADGSPVGTTLV